MATEPNKKPVTPQAAPPQQQPEVSTWQRPHIGPPPESKPIPNATGEIIVVPLNEDKDEHGN